MTRPLLDAMTRDLTVKAQLAARWNTLYNAEAPVGYVDPEVKRLYGARVMSLFVNHAATVVNPVVQRLELVGFRSSAGDVVDNDVTELARTLGLFELAGMAHVESMVTGWASFMVWSIDGLPVITPESPTQVTVMRDPVTRREVAALKRYRDEHGHVRADLITADTHEVWLSKRAAPLLEPGVLTPDVLAEDLVLASTEPNALAAVPVVTLVNQPRITAPDGRSDLADVESLLIAIAKLCGDMMTASEANAIPRRLLTFPSSITREQATEARDLMVQSMAVSSAAYMGILGGGADMKELSTASLDNFDRAIRLLVGQVAAIGGLPPYFVSSDVVNPTSADAIRSAEARLTSRVVERQRWYGPAYARLMQLAAMVRDGVADPRLDGLTALWRDPTPASVGQQADATTKLLAGGVIDRRAALESLGLPPLEIERILSTSPVIA